MEENNYSQNDLKFIPSGKLLIQKKMRSTSPVRGVRESSNFSPPHSIDTNDVQGFPMISTKAKMSPRHIISALKSVNLPKIGKNRQLASRVYRYKVGLTVIIFFNHSYLKKHCLYRYFLGIIVVFFFKY